MASKFFAACLLLLCASAHGASFIEGGVIGVPAGGPSSAMQPVIFINTYTTAGVPEYPENEWIVASAAGLVHPRAVAVYLSGLLVITHGTTSGICDLTVAFRAVGETIDYAYVMQTIEAHAGGGQRSNAGAWVALDAQGRFEFKWVRTAGAPWPDGCAYAINLRATAYVR